MTAPQRLAEIVRALEPRLRARIARIHVEPSADGGWDARISYLLADMAHMDASGGGPPETRYWLDLPLEQAEPALREQVRDLQALAELGGIRVEHLGAACGAASSGGHAACSLAHPGWLLEAHSGSPEERCDWLTRLRATPLATAPDLET
jgi:hypothetical protein